MNVNVVKLLFASVVGVTAGVMAYKPIRNALGYEEPVIKDIPEGEIEPLDKV